MLSFDSFQFHQRFKVSAKQDDVFRIKYTIKEQAKTPYANQDNRNLKQQDDSQNTEDPRRKKPAKYVEKVSKNTQPKILLSKQSLNLYNELPLDPTDIAQDPKDILPEPKKTQKKYFQKSKQESQAPIQKSTEPIQVSSVPQNLNVDSKPEAKIAQSRNQEKKGGEKLEFQQLEQKLSEDEKGLQQLTFKKSSSSHFSNLEQVKLTKRASDEVLKTKKILYCQHTNLKEIQESRQRGDRQYFRGTIEYKQDLKHFCRIISDQLDGYLIAQGSNSNRCLHRDQVFFRVVNESRQRVECQVVAIVSRFTRQVVGRICYHPNKKIYYLRPTNKRLHTMEVNPQEVQKNLIDNTYFQGQFSQWKQQQQYPRCHILNQAGLLGDLLAQTNALCTNYAVDESQYTAGQVEKYLQSFRPHMNSGFYQLPEEPRKKRRDFRKWRTIVVSDGAYDAAYSVRLLTNPKGKNFLQKQIYQVNVHISDVAFFVSSDSQLDQQISRRLVSYNLIHKQIGLLPYQLQKLCRFNLNQETLCLSIAYHVDQQGNILDSFKVTQSIIKPLSVFKSSQIETILNQKQISVQEWKKWNCGCQLDSEFKQISNDMRILSSLILKSRQLRVNRGNGALVFQTPTKQFTLNNQRKPVEFKLSNRNQVHFTFEQCVVVAGIKLAEYLFKNLKDKTILYRQRFPRTKSLIYFRQQLKKAGQVLPGSRQIQKNINQTVMKPEIKQCVRDMIKYETIRLFESSSYLLPIDGDPLQWQNYTIGSPLFVNCFNPISSYADILVQRQIVSLLEGQNQLNQPSIAKTLELYNRAKLVSSYLQNSCQKILLCMYLREKPLFCSAVLTQVHTWGLKVCVPQYDFITSISFNQISGLRVVKYDGDFNNRRYVKLEFKKEQLSTMFALKEMQQVRVQIRCSQGYPLDYEVSIVMPHPNAPNQNLIIC